MRRLEPEDATLYARFRAKMLHDAPWAFAASPEEDTWLDPARGASRLAEPENAILVIDAPTPSSSLAAAAGIYRQRSRKAAHRAGLWGVFVGPEWRGRGFGHAVVGAALQLASTWSGVAYVDLGVSVNSPEAMKLYSALGFRAWGREPESLQIDGTRFDEIFMTLKL